MFEIMESVREREGGKDGEAEREGERGERDRREIGETHREIGG